MAVLKGRRIFYVEDNVSNIAIVKTILEQSGAKVEIDRWGHRSLDKLKRFAPVDIIILDLMLPNDITGFDLCEQMRGLEGFEDVPIIALSAMDAAIGMKKAKLAGFDGFISKPVEFGVFDYQIADVIAGKSIWYAK